MGKTKPLTIAVHTDLYHLPWVQALKDKGHTVTDGLDVMDIWRADLILGPTCARFLPGMEKYLDSFIKGARAVKYKGKKDD